MSQSYSCLLICFLLSGCAIDQGKLPKAPTDIPFVWAQKPEERGSLPVGRVVAIERRYESMPEVRSKHAEAGRGIFAMLVVIPLALVAAPVILASHAVGVDLIDENPEVTNEGNVYRHTVRLAGSDEEITRDEYWTYQVGDCVAVRSNPELLVAALPGECP